MPVNGRGGGDRACRSHLRCRLDRRRYVTCVCRFRERGQEVRQLQRMAAGPEVVAGVIQPLFVVGQITGFTAVYAYCFNKLAHIFLFYFIVFAFPTALGGDTAAGFEIELTVLLFDEAYHNGAVQPSAGIAAHDPGVETSFVAFRFGNDLHGARFGSAGYGAGRQ